MSTLFQDIRYALRMLGKSPAFTAIAIVTLALGIGANTAIFSVVNSTLLAPLTIQKPAQVVNLWATSTIFDFPNLGLSAPDVADLRAQGHSFSQVAMYEFASKILTDKGAPEPIQGLNVSVEYFPLLEVQPLYGRVFQQGEMEPGRDREIILSYKFWSEQFGGDPRSTIGQTITLDKQPYVVIGIMPPQFHFLYDAKYATPLAPAKKDVADRGSHFIPAIARLKPGVTVRQAQAELGGIAARLAKAYPDADKGWGFRAVSLRTDLNSDTRTPLLILFGAVGFVLLIACANVGNLFLSRGWARRRELAIRATLGATRFRLIRQLLVESTLLALAGGACGLLMAWWGVSALKAEMTGVLIPAGANIAMDNRVLLFTLGASIIAGLVFGLAPAFLFSRQDLSAAVKEGGAGAQTGASSSRHNPLRQTLVVTEIALALVLVIGATLALRSFAHLLSVNLGYRTDHILTMRIDFPSYEFKNQTESTAFIQQLLAQTRALPGVENAAASMFAPLSGGRGESSFEVEGAPSQKGRANFTSVTRGYFDALGIPLLAGRDFTDQDNKGTQAVYIVNQTLARRVFGKANPIGKRLSQGKDAKKNTIWAEVIGVVGDTRDQSAGEKPQPELYVPFGQSRFTSGGIGLIFHTKTDPQSAVSAIKDSVWSLEKDQPITNIKTMDQLVAESNATPRFQSVLLGAFGALGLLLAIVGIYGVISYSVTQRTHEIGIRMALGAEPSQVMHLILTHGLKLAVIGVVIGIGAALGLTRLMSSLLFGVSATDPLTFAGTALLLLGVALAACYIPARRAMKVDPMVALRYE